MLRRGLCIVLLPTRPDVFLEPIPQKGFKPVCDIPEGLTLQTKTSRSWLTHSAFSPSYVASWPEGLTTPPDFLKVCTIGSGTDVPFQIASTLRGLAPRPIAEAPMR